MIRNQPFYPEAGSLQQTVTPGVNFNHERYGKSEHRMLEERILQLNRRRGQAEEYLSFADLLSKHIRFEERVLFPYLEVTLSLSTLKQVGAYLLAEHQTAFVDNYPDEFWTSE